MHGRGMDVSDSGLQGQPGEKHCPAGCDAMRVKTMVREGFREEHGYCWVAPGAERIIEEALKTALTK